MIPIPQNIQDAADEAFRSFCEGELPESHPFQNAWDRHESHHGEIEDGMPLCSFIQAAILYGVQWQQTSSINPPQIPAIDRYIEKAIASGQIYREVDGYYCYTSSGGTMDSLLLRAIADKLDELNADWDAQVQVDSSKGDTDYSDEF